MHHDARHQVILAEMARAARAGHPEADWHEIEPMLRRIWNHAPRRASWEHVRGEAALLWRFGTAQPPIAPVIDPAQGVVAAPECAR